ncbi:MAG: NAD(P)/FAD-dependent oxidoreductase [Bacilli bacterium]
MKEIYDVAIIGAGPAGITSAIYTERAELSCCIIEKETPGGQLNKTSTVENYPGYIKITGPDLAMKFYDQLSNLNVKQIFSEATNIEIEENIKKITLKNGQEIKAKAIILAIGRRPKKLETTNSQGLEGKGISFCSLCDGNLYKNEDVSIVGAGNSALEESLYLSDICKTVTIINRGNNLKGDKVLIDRVNEKENIKIINNSTIEKFNEEESILKSITIKEKDQERTLDTKACFIFIGYEPATNFLKNLDILDEKGYIIVDEQKKTPIKGIYAAGDTIKKDAFQIVTATSDGALAAISCIKDLKEV